MIRLLSTYVFCICLFGSVYSQISDRQIDRNQYPANNTPDTKREAIFSTYFQEANVSNLHVYLPESDIPYDYYFKGTALPRGLFGIFDKEWRDKMPEEFQAYAVFSIRGEGKPYYILRFSGAQLDPTIALFEMIGNQLVHKADLATFWCTDKYCLQKDSWLQDFDGDVRLDILTKVKMTDDRRGEQVIDEYYRIMRQLEDGAFTRDSQLDVDVNDYFMNDASE